MTAAFAGIPWISPPGAAGLAMAMVFACAALACGALARSGVVEPGEAAVWRAAAALLALLALNAAIATDRHIALCLREVAQSEGWYAVRRPLQVGALAALIAVLAGAALRTWQRLGLSTLPRALQIVFAANALLLAVPLLRAVSHHQTDRWLDSRLAVASVGRWIEILCLGLVLWTASRRWSIARDPAAADVPHV